MLNKNTEPYKKKTASFLNSKFPQDDIDYWYRRGGNELNVSEVKFRSYDHNHFYGLCWKTGKEYLSFPTEEMIILGLVKC